MLRSDCNRRLVLGKFQLYNGNMAGVGCNHVDICRVSISLLDNEPDKEAIATHNIYIRVHADYAYPPKTLLYVINYTRWSLHVLDITYRDNKLDNIAAVT